MSKVKAPKAKGVPNKHLHARTTFLYQAATYLSLQTAIDGRATVQTNKDQLQTHSPLALHLGSDLQQVSRKGQLRLSVELKRSMCKSCNTILVPGHTATQTVENPSKGGKKPWADVLLIECKLCGCKKRFPIGAKRQLSKLKRNTAAVDTASGTGIEDEQQSESVLLIETETGNNTG